MKRIEKLIAATALATGMLAPAAVADGDPAKGERIFRRCQACHSLEQGQNRIGPSLYGLFGREAGSVEGFRYSKANQESGVTWNEETLDPYLENPNKYMPGNRMAFPGIRNDEQRADLIAYLKEATAAEGEGSGGQ